SNLISIRLMKNFFRRLKNEYPSLTPSDLKLCAYLRLNLATKEIAPLLNISVRGVEIRRYRLRKKLELPQEKNLVEFMMEF
ncbi:helix-turn-helix transcriptional regulator, partial [Prolixibacter sp. NT017]|uniref:helix-turn-helix transcriptional regulator n=1 Tax=Prolixibacter sp. NT017 TaxID=2652390 RepID=UPI0035A27EF1